MLPAASSTGTWWYQSWRGISTRGSLLSIPLIPDLEGSVKMIRAAEDDQGVILIALLWILVALSVIALSVSRESLVEVAVARNSRDLGDAYYVARAGIATATYRLMERRYTAPPVHGVALARPPRTRALGELPGDFGGGSFKVEIQDESGKINLNFVGEDQLRLLVEGVGIGKPD